MSVERIALYIVDIHLLSYLLATNNFFKPVDWFFMLFVVLL